MRHAFGQCLLLEDAERLLRVAAERADLNLMCADVEVRELDPIVRPDLVGAIAPPGLVFLRPRVKTSPAAFDDQHTSSRPNHGGPIVRF